MVQRFRQLNEWSAYWVSWGVKSVIIPALFLMISLNKIECAQALTATGGQNSSGASTNAPTRNAPAEQKLNQQDQRVESGVEADVEESSTPKSEFKTEQVQTSQDTPSLVQQGQPNLTESLPVTYKEKEIFLLYFTPEQKKLSAQRVKRLIQSIEQAIELQNDQPHAIVRLVDSQSLQLYIHGQFVGEFKSQELEPQTRSVEQVRANMAGQVEAFVSDQVEKRIWQSRARKFFLSFFILIAGLIVFSQIRQLFDRWEQRFQERKNSIHPIAFMSETVVTSDTLSSFLTLGLVVGRFAVYSLIFFGALFGIFSQFDNLREIGPQILDSIYRRVGWGARSTIQKIPGVFLALILLICLQITIRFLSLLSKNFAAGRLKLKGLDSHRLPVARSVGVVLAILVLVPLIFGALFGDFNSPAQTSLHILTLAVSLGTVPLFIEFATGAYLMWNGELKEGMWIQCKGEKFEIVHLGLIHATAVPLNSGRSKWPYHSFITHPFEILPEAPKATWTARIKLPDVHSVQAYSKKVVALAPASDLNSKSLNLRVESIRDNVVTLHIQASDTVDVVQLLNFVQASQLEFAGSVLELTPFQKSQNS